MTGNLKIQAEAGKDHDQISAHIKGYIKYGRKPKDSLEKDAGFKYTNLIDSTSIIAEAGK